MQPCNNQGPDQGDSGSGAYPRGTEHQAGEFTPEMGNQSNAAITHSFIQSLKSADFTFKFNKYQSVCIVPIIVCASSLFSLDPACTV